MVHNPDNEMLAFGTPALSISQRLASARSIWALPVTGFRHTMSLREKARLANSATTSSPTSKQRWQIDAPTTASIPHLSAPSSTIVSMAFATIPFTVPFHPAWTAAISPLLGSHSNIGTQSAVNTPIATFGSRVTSASTSVGGVGGMLSITATLVLWVCRAVTMCSVPSRVRRRLRQSSTCAGLSPVYPQQLNSE